MPVITTSKCSSIGLVPQGYAMRLSTTKRGFGRAGASLVSQISPPRLAKRNTGHCFPTAMIIVSRTNLTDLPYYQCGLLQTSTGIKSLLWALKRYGRRSEYTTGRQPLSKCLRDVSGGCRKERAPIELFPVQKGYPTSAGSIRSVGWKSWCTATCPVSVITRAASSR